MTSIAALKSRVKALHPVHTTVTWYIGEPEPEHYPGQRIVFLDPKQRQEL